MILKLNEDLIEALMLIANGNISEYKELLGLSVSEFLIRFEIFIKDLTAKKTDE